MNHNEFVQALKAGKVSGAYLFEGVEENIKSVKVLHKEKNSSAAQGGAGGRTGGAERERYGESVGRGDYCGV